MTIYETLRRHLCEEYGLTPQEAHIAIGDFAAADEQSGGNQVVTEALGRILGLEGNYFDVSAVTDDARRRARENVDNDKRHRAALESQLNGE